MARTRTLPSTGDRSQAQQIARRQRERNSAEHYAVAVQWGKRLAEQWWNSKRGDERPSHVECAACQKRCQNIPSACKKHIESHRPMHLRALVCPHCSERFGQESHLVCHVRSCTSRPESIQVPLATCYLIIQKDEDHVFACGFQTKHARNVTRHRQDAHGQPTLKERRLAPQGPAEGESGYRKLASKKEKEDGRVVLVWMDCDCTTYDTSDVPPDKLAEVEKAFDEEVRMAPARIAAARAKRLAAAKASQKQLQQLQKKRPPRAEKASTAGTTAARKARMPVRAASAPVVSPTTSELTSLPPSPWTPAGSPPPLEAPSAPASTSSTERASPASTALRTPSTPVPQLLPPQQECVPEPSAPELYADRSFAADTSEQEPYATAAHDDYGTERHQREAHATVAPYSHGARTGEALPGFQDAFRDVPPPPTQWSAVPPAAIAAAAAYGRPLGMPVDLARISGVHGRHPSPYTFATPLAHIDPRLAMQYNLNPYMTSVPPQGLHPFVEGSSRDVYASHLQRADYRSSSPMPHVNWSADKTFSAASPVARSEEPAYVASPRSLYETPSFSLRRAQW